MSLYSAFINPYKCSEKILVFDTDFTEDQREWLDKVFPDFDPSDSDFLLIYYELHKDELEHVAWNLTKSYMNDMIKQVTHEGFVYVIAYH